MRKKTILLILLTILTIGIAGFFAVQVVQSDSPTKHLELAKDALKQEDLKKSIELFTKILDEDPSHIEARTGLVSAYMGLEDFDQAIAVLEEGIELLPKEPQFYYFLSAVHEELNDLPHVMKAIQDGIDATDNTALKELNKQIEANITIAMRHYVQEGHHREILLEWKKMDGSIVPVEAEWELENEENGTLDEVSNTKMEFHAEELGEVTLSATIGSITKEATLHIEEHVVEEMTITPEEIDPVSIGQEIELSVSGVDADGDEMEFTPEWRSEDEEIAQVSESEGVQVIAEALAEGVTSITASFQDLDKEMDFIVEGDNKYIKASANGQGNIRIHPDKTSYPTGTEVTLEAMPSTGYEFVRWDGDVSGTTNPLDLTLDSSMSVVAVFEPIGHALDLSISGEGQIIRDTLDNQIEAGTTITLYAQPKSGWRFSHWSGSVSGSDQRIHVLMDGNKDIQAVFERYGSFSGSSSSGRATNSESQNDVKKDNVNTPKPSSSEEEESTSTNSNEKDKETNHKEDDEPKEESKEHKPDKDSEKEPNSNSDDGQEQDDENPPPENSNNDKDEEVDAPDKPSDNSEEK